MKKRIKSLVFLMLVAVLSLTCVMSCAAISIPEVASVGAKAVAGPEIVVSGSAVNINILGTVQLKAEVKGTSETPAIKWASSDKSVATVSSSGKVTGLKIGRTMITAYAEIGGKRVEGKYAVNVVASKNALKSYLEENAVLSYQYSYVDDYYYANDKKSWQHVLGFARIYDIIAPYLVLEYDYTRVFFTYDKKDFMIQLWKGQYGYLFYGGEIGIYHKKANGRTPGMLTFFKQADEKYWPYMEMSVYHQNITGEYVREFTRDYDKYWWCTGFKPGHLRIVEPADELRIVARLTMKDAEMARLFAQGLKDCGFNEKSDKNSLGLDEYAREGKDVYLTWQNISEAENTMPLKLTVFALAFFNVFGLLAAAILIPLGIGPFLLLMIIL